MKKYDIRYFVMIVLIFLASTSCEEYLEENSISIQTTESYYVDETGYNDLIESTYSLLRDIHQERELVFFGTDVFTSKGWNEAGGGNDGGVLNVYDVRFNSSNGSVSTLWNLLYKEIGRTNTAITRQSDIVGMDENLLAARAGEAKFLRAFCYFYLVQQFGDIPMPLEETTTGSREVIKFTAAEVYTQIIKDLTEAEAVLPTSGNTDYGRATKGAAQFLLARVYLTRGWNYTNTVGESIGGSASDFDKAVEYADKVISAYPLEAEYKNLFPLHAENPLLETFPVQNDRNDEIIFAVQYSDDVLSYGGGNDYHSIFGGSAEDIPGSLGRTSDYNRHAVGNYITTPAMYRLFDPELDVRYKHNFVEAMYALADVNGFVPNLDDPTTTIDIAVGDTVLFFPDWNKPASDLEKGMDVGGTKHYGVLNIDEIGIMDGTPFHQENYKTPLMWKFWQPGIEYDDAMGTLDYVLFRSSEAYLIAAEAILKGASNGNLGDAESYYNTIVDRALGANIGSDPQCAAEPGNLSSFEIVSYRANGNLDIDMILDERARELMGEFCRWYDLKRTGKWIERASAMNPWTSAIGEIQEHHYLRPIPQAEIDRAIPTISQNDGY
ncbi:MULTISPECIES: RagB/SusD family nutrient uptake outer membrane protein [unclassified Saccharicrinis]|uniref:RagB/SusD family nutrient uptake outer membrane protein n=1 Tax=unclassified Saccharicrinis TaxID=2646859 RepID=UPI003D348C65